MRCRICGKELSNPMSIKKGIGPECEKKETEWYQLRFDDDIPEDENIINGMIRRTEEVQKVHCPGCGYKCLKPITWEKSTCIICKLSGNKHIFNI